MQVRSIITPGDRMQSGVKGLLARLGRKEPAATVVTERPRVTNPYHAVSIIPGSEACDAVKACVGVRFLSKEAPRLPVPGCDRSDCRCHYAHHDDRRSLIRRIGDGRGASPNNTPYKGPERRLLSSAGRRGRDGL
jgi:hypothetical protein